MGQAAVQIDFDVIVVGAGFAGMYALYRLRPAGLSARVFETGGGVGGTWYWNRYPGARCDIESVQYSYQFSDELQQDWTWSERYASQPEILEYANHVADRFDLRRDIQFNTRVVSAIFDEAAGCWTVETGESARVTARFCIMATGNLSAVNTPAFPGQDSFRGAIYHTGHWPHERVDFSGQRVAIIGTGSSAIQSIPLIAEEATSLAVFQRTPSYVVPAHNGRLSPEVVAAIKADYKGLRERASKMPSGIAVPPAQKSALEASPDEQQRAFEERYAIGGFAFIYAYNDIMLKKESNDVAAEFLRAKIRAIIKDPRIATLLSPTTVVGCKRLCLDTGYWETFNRSNVSLVDVSKTPIERLSESGIIVDGREHPVDAIVFATGFDAMTGALNKIDIRGIGGRTLKDKWAEGPKTYLGIGIAGFPNFFLITGPGSPSVLTNVIPSIEHHVEWIVDCLVYLSGANKTRVVPAVEAEEAWVDHVRDAAELTLRSTCSSWYLGANIPGKPRVFMPYAGRFPAYVEYCREVAANGFRGFDLR